MPRRRAFVPENTQAMWEFCRHCGAPFPPEETAVRGVCVFVNKEIDISLCRFSTLRWQAPTHLPS